MLTLIYFVLILGVIVLVHEFGHFIFSKLFGVYVHEFSIGMGPAIFQRQGKNKETTYSLRAIPIGGYCALAGEDDEMDKDVPKDRCLQNKPIWQRFIIMVAGAMNNFILAVIILLLIATFVGAPNLDPIIGSVETGGPAEQAGLEAGDRVTRINNDKVSTTDDLAIFLQLADMSKPVTFYVTKEDGTETTYEVTPIAEEVDGTTTYRIGVTIDNEVRHDVLSVLSYTARKTGSLFKQMIISFQALFTGRVGFDQLSGPVGIYQIVGAQSETGLANMLYLVALLSVNVGFLNLLPIPAMDGGRIFLLLIELIKRKPVKPETENLVNTVGFILLLALMLLITINDVVKLF